VNEIGGDADRIRENFRKMRKASVTEIMTTHHPDDLATIITHGCTRRW